MEVFQMKTLADRLKEGMTIRGLRQADVVEKTGINKGALSSYLSGRYEPKQNNIFLLAQALKSMAYGCRRSYGTSKNNQF